ncbi:MAG: helix-turn-helix domain-containing protein [Nocardioides sp.]
MDTLRRAAERAGGRCGAHGSAARVAEHLHCHPNTVLNRLRAVATLTGSDPRRPGELLRLVTELAILDRHEASGSASVSPAD